MAGPSTELHVVDPARLDELPGVVHLSSQAAAWQGRQDVYVGQEAHE